MTEDDEKLAAWRDARDADAHYARTPAEREAALFQRNLADEVARLRRDKAFADAGYARATAALERAEAELAERCPCICNTGPGTEGPDEYCPRHGRTYDDVLGRWGAAAEELDALRGRLGRLAAGWEAYDSGYGMSDLERRRCAADVRREAGLEKGGGQ